MTRPINLRVKWNCLLYGFWTALRDGKYQAEDFPKVKHDVIRALNKHNRRVKRYRIPKDIHQQFCRASTIDELSNATQSIYDWAENNNVLILGYGDVR